MLYRQLNQAYSHCNQKSNYTSEKSDQILLLTNNKPFTFEEEEMKYINSYFENQELNFTLIKYKLNKNALTKIVRSCKYHLRNRKTIKRKRYQLEQQSDSEYSLSQNPLKQKDDDTYGNDNDVNEDEKDELYSLLSEKSNQKNIKQEKIFNRLSKVKNTNKHKSKDKYEKRFDKIISSFDKKEENKNINDGQKENEEEFVTNAQASAIFGEMLKVLNKKQNKKQRKMLKEEMRLEKRNKIMSFKQKIHFLSLNQIKELYNEFFQAENENNETNMNLNFEKLTDEQINQFSTKLDIFENLNKINKETHKTFKEELELMKKDKETQNKQSIIQISSKDIPFFNEYDEFSSDSSSSEEENNNDKCKDCNSEEKSNWSFGDSNNNLLKNDAQEKITSIKLNNKIDNDEDVEDGDFNMLDNNKEK